jgi:glycerate kinase
LLDPTQLAPMTANTRGVGELILTALEQGAERIILGIGGSATNDGGMGMAQALGAVFVDTQGRPLEPGGGSLIEIAAIDITGLDPRLKEVNIQVICDVDNPLLGEQGAARVFGPQKGATPQQVAALEAGLAHFGDVLDAQFGIDVRDVPGAGAAGGLGAGAIVFLDADLQPGAEVVLDLLGFDEVLKGADLVFTAEGQLDAQTAFGKAPAAVAQRARAAGIPCIAIAGSLGEGVEGLAAIGIDTAYSLCNGQLSLADAMANAAELIKATATQAMNNFCVGHRAGIL